MDDEEIERSKKFYEKRQQGAAKKLKKDFTKKSTSSPTGEKGPVPMANSQRKGKKAVPMANSQRKEKKVVSTETPRRTFATAVSRRPVVRSWYNQELKIRDKETWDKFNACFRAIQFSDMKAAIFWLSQLERSHFSQKERNYILKRKLEGVTQLVTKLLSISSTSKSEMLTKRKRRRTFSLELPLNRGSWR